MASMIWCTTAASRALGIDHETAEFAVESIRRWWKSVGSKLYPRSRELLIVADGGGSNGARNRLWKQQVQYLATDTGLAITVCHLPPANGTRILPIWPPMSCSCWRRYKDVA
jgi:hypothetical protein